MCIYKILSLMYLSATTHVNLCMYQAKKLNTLQWVKSASHVGQYTGMIVAYKTSSHYSGNYLVHHESYCINQNEPTLHYGYIKTWWYTWVPCDEPGYQMKKRIRNHDRWNINFHLGYGMQRLVKKDAIPLPCVLGNDKILDKNDNDNEFPGQEYLLAMRAATAKEKNIICKALLAKQAVFEYMCRNEQQILEALGCFDNVKF